MHIKSNMHMHLILDMHKLFAKRTILESNIGEQKNISISVWQDSKKPGNWIFCNI